jgi:NADH-ubiquinone oxidoreductase chain 5
MTSKVLDRGVIELIGPFGLSQSLYGASSRLASADTGSISTYGLYIFVGAIAITLLLFAPVLSGVDSSLSSLGDIRLALVYGAALFYIGSGSETSAPTVPVQQ